MSSRSFFPSLFSKVFSSSSEKVEETKKHKNVSVPPHIQGQMVLNPLPNSNVTHTCSITASLNKGETSPKKFSKTEDEFDFAKYEITAEHPITLSKEEAKQILNRLKEQNQKISTEHYSPYNVHKDRYTNNLQLQATMVEVFVNNERQAYNGAMFVSPYSNQKYVFMQGPLESTVELTQLMVKQNTVTQIVCLTKAVEKNVPKCHPYWGKWDSKQGDGFIIRTPNLGEEKEWGKITMYHFEEWPDLGAPNDIDQFIQLVELQRKEREKNGVVAIHCSAGLGRTGVYALTSVMMDLIEKGEKKLNPIELVMLLRKTRPGLVQSRDQLIFCFEVANKLVSKKF